MLSDGSFCKGSPVCSVRKQSNSATAFLPGTSGPLSLVILVERWARAQLGWTGENTIHYCTFKT